MADTLENGNEGSVNLASSPEQPKVDSVKSNQDKFAEKMASLRNKEQPKVEKPVTTEISKQEVTENAVETKDTKPVKENSKYKYTKEEGKIKGLERIARERDKRIAALETELNKIKQGGNKTRDDYESDLDFIQDISSRKAQEIALDREYQREKTAKEQSEIDDYYEKVESQVKDANKYHERAKKYANDFESDQLTNDYVFKSDVGFKMLDAILDKFETEPGAREEFLNMPTAKKNILLFNLEKNVRGSEVSNTMQNQKSDEIKVSKAPTSIAPVKGEKVSEPVDIKSRFNQKLNLVRAGYTR